MDDELMPRCLLLTSVVWYLNPSLVIEGPIRWADPTPATLLAAPHAH